MPKLTFTQFDDGTCNGWDGSMEDNVLQDHVIDDIEDILAKMPEKGKLRMVRWRAKWLVLRMKLGLLFEAIKVDCNPN